MKHLSTSSTIIRKWILNVFQEHKVVVKEMLRQSKSNIHLSFDLWTSENNMIFLAVISHFIDHNKNPRIIMLAIRRIHDSYSGENMAQEVIVIIRDYNIARRLEYFVLDNAESNNTCVDAILKAVRSNLEKKARRLRCLGYIINLAVQALLFDIDPNAFTVEILVATKLKHERKLLNVWRKRDPLGKLHNIVKFIRSSPQRRERFRAIECDVMAIADLFEDLMI